MKEIYNKLLQLQASLKVPKNQYNKFGNFNYRSCEDILEKTKPICQDLGILITVSDEMIQLGDRFYVKSTAKAISIDNGDEISCYGYAREEVSKKGMDSMQLTGATSSYARKYALNGLLAIDDNKDADDQVFNKTNNNYKKNNDRRGSAVITDKQVRYFWSIANKKQIPKEEVRTFLNNFGYSSTADIKMADFNNILEAIKAY